MSATAQADIQGRADALAAEAFAPGVAIGWVSAEAQGLAHAGLRRVGEDGAVGPDDLWHVGSITKSMTAMLAARMVEAGQISWDSTVGVVLGEAYPGMLDGWRDRTLQELLRHRSGIMANPGLVARYRLGDGPRDAYVRFALSRGPAGARGAFLYSNMGYIVAGAMLEAAGGAPWEELIAVEVFAPLGMESAGFGPPVGDQPYGHRSRQFGGLVPVAPGPQADNVAAYGPAGRVHLSGADLLRYLRAHLMHDPGFLSAETWERLHTGPDYALGLGVGDGELFHSGSNTMWYARILIDRAAGCASFVAVNAAVFPDIVAPVDALNAALIEDGCRD